MDLRQMAPGARTTVGRWSATLLLGVTAFVAGAALVSPVCYWQGLQWWEQDGRHMPAAYAPEIAPWNFVLLGIFAAWAALWLLHARRVWGSPIAVLHSGLPMAIFILSAWQASLFAYACNPF